MTLQNVATVKNLLVNNWNFFPNHLKHYVCGKLKPKFPLTQQQFFCILDVKTFNICTIIEQ